MVEVKVPSENGVPRWVEERFAHLDHEIGRVEDKFDSRLDDLGEKVERLSDKLGSTRESMSNLLGRFAIVSAGIGAATAALFTLLTKLIAR